MGYAVPLGPVGGVVAGAGSPTRCARGGPRRRGGSPGAAPRPRPLVVARRAFGRCGLLAPPPSWAPLPAPALGGSLPRRLRFAPVVFGGLVAPRPRGRPPARVGVRLRLRGVPAGVGSRAMPALPPPLWALRREYLPPRAPTTTPLQ